MLLDLHTGFSGAGYSHLFKRFPQFIMSHTIKGFSIADATEVDVFLEFTKFLYDPVNVGNLISGSSSFSKPNLQDLHFLSSQTVEPWLGGF